jgi:hypothetical protein
MLHWRSYRDLFHGRSILWQTRWGYTCLGLARLCPIRIVTCIDDSTTHDLIARQHGIRFFALDSTTGRHSHGRDEDLDRILPAFREPIVNLLADGRWTLVSPLACPALAAFAVETGRELICPPAELSHWLNDKANFLAALDGIGLPRLPGRWLHLTGARYAELASEMGSRLVAQLARGVSGSGTVFIGSEDDYAAAGARFGETPVWVAPDVGDLSLNINAIATVRGVIAGYPSVQLTGLPPVCARRGGYCGNDYAATREVPAEIRAAVVEHTRRIGRWLISLGFRGLFGLDFVVAPASGEIYAVDLNPRWQGSTSLLAQAEYQAGRLPLPVAELAYRMGLLEDTELLRRQDAFLEPVAVSHISLRSPVPGWARVAGDVHPGVYSANCFLRPGLDLEDLAADGEFLVTGGLPRQGTWIGPGAHIVRVTATHAAIDPHQNRPLPWVQAAARQLYDALRLTPEEP